MWCESEMPVKDFILLVVYFLVHLACNFAKKTHLAVTCVTCVTQLRWMKVCLKEGREKNFESKYHDVKVESLKQQSNLVFLDLWWRRINLKIKPTFLTFIKYVTIIK